eukprot:6493990-Pyramimonas_sp.AAC.1
MMREALHVHLARGGVDPVSSKRSKMQGPSPSETMQLMPRICDDGCTSGPMRFALADAPDTRLALAIEWPSSSSSPAAAEA